MSERPPNILVMMSDQHSKHALGCFGNPVVRTPNLDRLAGEGLRFTNVYCPAPLCGPSRMSFLTSRTPSRNQVWDNSHILSGAIPTFAHYLNLQGYETALIGRMHVNGSERLKGFQRSACRPYEIQRSFPTGVEVPAVGNGQSRGSVEIAGTGSTTSNQIFDRLVADDLIGYLKEKAKAPEKPFAAVASTVLPHNPYIAPKELLEYYLERVDVPKVEENQPASVIRMRKRRGFTDPELPVERIRLARAAYYALCEVFDGIMGLILEGLEEAGLAENTFVLYCTDHGDLAGEHGLWCKSNFYEGAAGVPMIARWPGVIEPGRVCPRVCNLMDIGPTLVEMAGGPPMQRVDGRSLLPLLRERAQAQVDWLDETFCEMSDLRGWPRGKNTEEDAYYPARMIRRGKFKLWVHKDEDNLPPSLFNVEDDPQELKDLGADPRFHEVRNELLERVMSGWEPERVRSLCREFSALGRMMKKFPPVPDASNVRRVELNADVKLL